MTLTQLETFLRVAELGSLSEAAKIMGVSQPAATRHIKSCERAFDAILFSRSPRGMGLTATGKKLIPHAAQIMSEIDRMRSLAQREARRGQAVQMHVLPKPDGRK